MRAFDHAIIVLSIIKLLPYMQNECDGQCGVPTYLQRIAASDGLGGDNFGIGLDHNEQWIAIGANQDGDRGGLSGSAYFFRNSHSGSVFAQKVIGSDVQAGDQFGIRACIDGNTAIFGAPGADGAFGDSGEAYIYRYNGVSWVEEAKLAASDPEPTANFGSSVAIRGDLAVVGSYRDDDFGIDLGSVYVFRRIQGVWQQEAKLLPSFALFRFWFGYSVALIDDRIFVGAPGEFPSANVHGGRVFVFRREGAA